MKRNNMKSWLLTCLGMVFTIVTIAGVSGVLKAPRGSGVPEYRRTETSINITFKPLQGDGEEPVSHRYVESRGPWNLAWKFRGMTSTSEYEVTAIRKGALAEYRGTASNAAGMSKRSTVSTSFIKIQ
ncbi:hypothetical protein [Gabonibacter massiliensis]|uniref:hypothetical protein n=1 Tax=Gabonibacter massiliensis TaxID=1720195 RepID=UPI0011C91D57|nr:hypothetical protein [Gabonibacter massiliensis]